MLGWLLTAVYDLLPSWTYLLIISRVYRTSYLLNLHKVYKFLLHYLLGTTELVRLCKPLPDEVTLTDLDGQLEGLKISPIRIMLIDLSLHYSTKLEMERSFMESGGKGLMEICQLVLCKKEFPNKGEINSPEALIFRSSLAAIIKSKVLVNDINTLAKIKYDSSNKRHEHKLLELWDAMKPDEKLIARQSKQWQSIGFQGKDPATDFRGMGILGLEDLLYFGKTYPIVARSILDESNHPVSWYSFAVVGIHITSYTVELLRTRLLQLHLFRYNPTLTTYREVYCYLFQRFHKFWFLPRSIQVTIMDFELLFKQFQNQIRQELLMLRTFPPINSLSRQNHNQNRIKTS